MSRRRFRSDNSFVAIQCLLSVVFVSFTIDAFTQQTRYRILTDADSAEVWFDQIVSPKNAAIVNGPEYHIAFKGLKTHPFYQSPESERSFARYDNDVYENVDLLYDTYGDILVLKCLTPNGAFFIKLDEKLVQRFDLHGHHFKKFDEGINAGIGAYFDVLFEQKQFAVVAKRVKLQRIEGRTRDYFVDDVYYILNNGTWIRITGNGSFYRILKKDQRKELTIFMKSNHINVRKRNDEDLRKVGAFCYSLNEKK